MGALSDSRAGADGGAPRTEHGAGTGAGCRRLQLRRTRPRARGRQPGTRRGHVRHSSRRHAGQQSAARTGTGAPDRTSAATLHPRVKTGEKQRQGTEQKAQPMQLKPSCDGSINTSGRRPTSDAEYSGSGDAGRLCLGRDPHRRPRGVRRPSRGENEKGGTFAGRGPHDHGQDGFASPASTETPKRAGADAAAARTSVPAHCGTASSPPRRHPSLGPSERPGAPRRPGLEGGLPVRVQPRCLRRPLPAPRSVAIPDPLSPRGRTSGPTVPSALRCRPRLLAGRCREADPEWKPQVSPHEGRGAAEGHHVRPAHGLG